MTPKVISVMPVIKPGGDRFIRTVRSELDLAATQIEQTKPRRHPPFREQSFSLWHLSSPRMVSNRCNHSSLQVRFIERTAFSFATHRSNHFDLSSSENH